MLAGFVHRAMAPRPELRFANATEMRLALEDIVSGKRQGTAKLAGVGVPYSPSAAAALGVADTAQPGASLQAAGATGTVAGAPIPAALSVTPNPQGLSVTPQPTPRGATEGIQAVPPMQTVAPFPHQAQQPYPSAHPPAMAAPQLAPAARTEKKKGNGLVVGLALVALLLGAGAVVSYVLSTQPSKPPVPPIDLGTTTATTTSPPVTTTPITPTAPVTTLTPGPQPAPQPAPGPAPAKKDGGAPPPAAKDAGTTPVGPINVHDAGGGQTNVVTPWGTVQVPGPRPIFWPPDQPWPPPTVPPPQ
jgi:hypothetical protein